MANAIFNLRQLLERCNDDDKRLLYEALKHMAESLETIKREITDLKNRR